MIDKNYFEDNSGLKCLLAISNPMPLLAYIRNAVAYALYTFPSSKSCFFSSSFKIKTFGNKGRKDLQY